jgi:hydrogenase expression/formation protein HypC
MTPGLGPCWQRETAMCLGIPGKVVEIYRENDVLMGKVDFSGVCKRVCLEHVPEVRPEEYVLVHVGFALSILDAAEAGRVFALLKEMNQLDELASPPVGEAGGPAHEIRR